MAGGLAAFAGALVVTTLVVQERLVLDPETKWPKLQARPIYFQEPGHPEAGHRFLYDPLLGWRNIPNWTATTSGRPLTINAKGLRGRERPYEKPSGASRLLVLGDSFGWGYGVADDEVFASLLERRLRQENRNWEVLNASVPGWGTDQEYLYLINEGFKFSPDLIVLAFFLYNDPANNASSVQYGTRKPLFRTTTLDLVGVPVPEPGSNAPVLVSTADPLDLTIAIIRKMSEASAERHCRLAVMKFGMFLKPQEPQVLNWESRFALALAAQVAVPYLDLDQVFDSQSIPTAALIATDDAHWSANGHRAVAGILYQFLIDTGLVS